MRKSLYLILSIVIMLFASTSWGVGFVNGDFELGNTTGWTVGGGYRGNILNNNANFIPSSFLPSGLYYNTTTGGYPRSAIVTPGIAPHTNNTLNQVYSGNYSFRAENIAIGGYASAIYQRVNSYTDPNIFFAWAAVLEGAHGTNDAATFKLVLRDETAGVDLVTRQYNAATGGGGVDARFSLSPDGFYYTAWQIENLPIGSALGHDISLSLLAADCEPTGHMGYVYLDGFGATVPIQGAPEPATLFVMGLGLIGLIGFSKKFKK